jgi:hypothetical protein
MPKKDQLNIILYKAKNGKTSLKVNLKEETVWLSQKQMAELFDKDARTINEHIKNIYKENELKEKSTIRNFRIVQKEGSREVERDVQFYNLDMIISVGYRVNSKRGTQFRIWATNILKQHLIKGYTRNTKRLRELEKTITILKNVVDTKKLKSDEATGLLRVLTEFNYALKTLNQYDQHTLKISNISKKELFRIDYEAAIKAIKKLKNKYSGSNLFGHEKDKSFQSSLSNIYQTFAGYRPPSHNLIELKKRVEKFIPQLKNFFFDESRNCCCGKKQVPSVYKSQKGLEDICVNCNEEARLFVLLAEAYVNARYSQDYRVSKEELEVMKKKVLKLKELVKKSCEEEIKKMREKTMSPLRKVM